MKNYNLKHTGLALLVSAAMGASTLIVGCSERPNQATAPNNQVSVEEKHTEYTPSANITSEEKAKLEEAKAKLEEIANAAIINSADQANELASILGQAYQRDIKTAKKLREGLEKDYTKFDGFYEEFGKLESSVAGKKYYLEADKQTQKELLGYISSTLSSFQSVKHKISTSIIDTGYIEVIANGGINKVEQLKTDPEKIRREAKSYGDSYMEEHSRQLEEARKECASDGEKIAKIYDQITQRDVESKALLKKVAGLLPKIDETAKRLPAN